MPAVADVPTDRATTGPRTCCTSRPGYAPADLDSDQGHGPHAFAGVAFAYHEVVTDGLVRIDDTEWADTVVRADDVPWMKPVLNAD